MQRVHDGKSAISLDGFSYLPRVFSGDEAEELIGYLARLHPIRERRHAGDEHRRRGAKSGQLLRPVYWLGAWQFACLGYYSEPRYRRDRCLRAEPYPDVMTRILERLRPIEDTHLADGELYRASTSALINYYGSELRNQPVDVARLRPHKDSEPGPVTMISVGQPAQFEFVDQDDNVEFGVWLRHRSACVFSGPRFKEGLYHRVTQVRHGREPAMTTTVPDFRLRRVSISFRRVPERFIHDWAGLSEAARAKIAPYLDELERHSEHFRALRRDLP